MKGILRRTATNSRHFRRRREVHLLRKPRPKWSQLKKIKNKEIRFPLLMYDPDSLMVHIKNMKIEDCDSFMDRLLV